MRKWLLLFGVLITNAMFAEISLDDLDASSEGLYTFFNGDQMEVVSLHRTLRGYEAEIKVMDHLEERGPVMDWKCPHFGHINTMFQK